MIVETEIHPDIRLAELAAEYKYDPLGFVYVAFPWLEKGTQLENYDGPCPCQIRLLTILGDEMRARAFDGKNPAKPIRIACSSGHGIGKSAFFGMVGTWILACWKFSQGSATANTFTQLSTKTWANIRKWLKLSIYSSWFEATSELIYHPQERDNWYLSTQSSDEKNSEAFAGQHAATSISYYINDECSGIPDLIFEVQEGGLTDGQPIIFAFGNPTRPTGKFARIMKGIEPGHWIKVRIDSRECPFTNKEEIAEWIEQYGEDSDFVRVRVLGLPPNAATSQFIGDDLIAEAQKRPASGLGDEPLIAGADFAWGGEDKNTIRFRCGLDARTIAPVHIPGEFTRDPSIMVAKLADVLTRDYNGRKVEMLFMDSAGIAGPIHLRLRELGFKNIMEVNFMAHSPDPKYKNVRSYIWGRMKEWLSHGAIDRNPALAEDLGAPEVLKHVPLLLEPKEAIIKRIGHSTDDADALALTFYMPVSSQYAKDFKAKRNRRPQPKAGSWMGV